MVKATNLASLLQYPQRSRMPRSAFSTDDTCQTHLRPKKNGKQIYQFDRFLTGASNRLNKVQIISLARGDEVRYEFP